MIETTRRLVGQWLRSWANRLDPMSDPIVGMATRPLRQGELVRRGDVATHGMFVDRSHS